MDLITSVIMKPMSAWQYSAQGKLRPVLEIFIIYFGRGYDWPKEMAQLIHELGQQALLNLGGTRVWRYLCRQGSISPGKVSRKQKGKRIHFLLLPQSVQFYFLTVPSGHLHIGFPLHLKWGVGGS